MTATLTMLAKAMVVRKRGEKEKWHLDMWICSVSKRVGSESFLQGDPHLAGTRMDAIRPDVISFGNFRIRSNI